MKFSLCLPTKRYGGLDLTLTTLAQQGFKDWEIIIADELYDERKDALKAYVEKQGLTDKVLHIKPKERPDEARYICRQNNAMNTALTYCHGEYMVFLGDYQAYHSQWLTRVSTLVDAFRPHAVGWLQHIGKMLEIGDPKGLITTFKEEYAPSTPLLIKYPDARYKPKSGILIPLWVSQKEAGVMNTFIPDTQYPFAVPLKEVLEINGFDEMFDMGRHGYEDIDLMFRLYKKGHNCFIDTWTEFIHMDHPREPVPRPNPNEHRCLARMIDIINGASLIANEGKFDLMEMWRKNQ